MDILKTFEYKNQTINLYYNGIYSCFTTQKGYIKAYTLTGIKALISKTLKSK